MSAPRASLPGHAGWSGGQRRSPCDRWSTSWFTRTRLTGPFTRNTASVGNWNCRCSNCCSGCEQVSITSSRTALPKCRCVSSMRKRLPQVVHLLLVDRQFGVARDAELREAAQRAAGEQVLQVRGDDRSQQHEGLLAAGDRRGHRDHARQRPRHLQDHDRRRPAERVLAVQLQDEVQRLVDDLREGMRRIQPDRRQQRPDLALQVLVHPFALGGVAVRIAQDHHAAPGKRRHHVLVVEQVLAAHECLGPRQDRPVVRRGRSRPVLAHLLGEVGQPHLEELVEVGRDDADVAQALGERHVVPRRHREHPLVERELRQARGEGISRPRPRSP